MKMTITGLNTLFGLNTKKGKLTGFQLVKQSSYVRKNILNILAGIEDHQLDTIEEDIGKVRNILSGGFNYVLQEIEKKIENKNYKVKKLNIGDIEEEEEKEEGNILFKNLVLIIFIRIRRRR